MRISKAPEPALVRSVLVAITGVIAYLLGREVDTAWIESVLVLYGLATPVLAGALIRPAVTPVRRSGGEPDAGMAQS
ncbi:hypothetical protein BOX37_31320 [Nocardia mangyaensis]|uniref:Uncharacterized protein n=1 Tax=Nocardia mangyaensis TaxID=2213200 RepID=A0A1J0W093_9NOCA|nr:hypothetical protein [Nocardia mangyaensis]APE37685.1 hypothetical protein BOX37_31320 [Nocardia mangyaensis]